MKPYQNTLINNMYTGFRGTKEYQKELRRLKRLGYFYGFMLKFFLPLVFTAIIVLLLVS